MNPKNVNGQKRSIFILLAIVFYIMIGSLGDAVGKDDAFLDKLKRATKKDFEMSPSELHIRMQELSLFYAGIIEKSGDEIMALTTDPVVKRNALLWKMSAIPAVYKAFLYSYPIVAMIDSWALCLQMKNFFKSEAGQNAFGKWYIYGYDATVMMEAKIVELAKLLSQTDDISLLENFVRSWANDHPIQVPLFVRESIIPIVSSEVGNEAMNAFQAASKLTYQLEDIANRFAIYGDHLPKQARWQAELLLSELGQHEKIEILIAELMKVTQELQQVGEVVEKLPDFITNERSAVLEVFRNERLETLSAVSKQRIETIDNINKQRIEALDYLIRERTDIIDAVNKQRIETIDNMNKQRTETLDYLTRERIAIIDALEKERKIALEVLESERRSVLNEIESMGSRIIQDSIKSLDKTIDHFFLRAAQLVGVFLIIFFCFGVVGLYLISRKRQVPQQ